MQAKQFMKNAVVLTGNSLLLRAGGMAARVWLAETLGGEGMGVYQLIFTLYNLGVALATSGVSVVGTRLVAEEPPEGGDCAVRTTAGWALALGCLAMGLQAGLARPLAVYLLGDARAAAALRILAPSLPFMALAACLRGYFLAHGQVWPNTVSQLAEQAVRLGLFWLLLPRAAGMELGEACAALVLANTISEIASCLLMLVFYGKDRAGKLSGRGTGKAAFPRQKVWHLLWPVEGSRCLAGALHTVENSLVPTCLALYLGSRAQGLAQYGVLHGMVLPLLFFPFSLLGALATLLLPEITRAYLAGRRAELARLLDKMLGLTLGVSVLAAGGCMLLGGRLAMLLYTDARAGHCLQALAPLLPCMYLESMVDGVLKGMDQQKASFRYSMVDSALRILLVLAVLPRYGLPGFLAIMYASNLFTCGMNLARMLQTAGLPAAFGRWLGRPLLAFAGSTAALLAMLSRLGVPEGWPGLLLAGGVYAGVYLLLGGVPYPGGKELRKNERENGKRLLTFGGG